MALVQNEQGDWVETSISVDLLKSLCDELVSVYTFYKENEEWDEQCLYQSIQGVEELLCYTPRFRDEKGVTRPMPPERAKLCTKCGDDHFPDCWPPAGIHCLPYDAWKEGDYQWHN